MDPFIGEIRMFAGPFAPEGWFLCDGQLLAINQYQALFAILGVTYGGNGATNFALPDLRGRYAMHAGQGSGLSPRTIGQKAGAETVTLINNQMPAHTHAANASSQPATVETPANGVWAAEVDSQGGSGLGYGPTPNTTLSPQAIGASGGSQPHDNMPPFTCVNFIIAWQGVFPPRP